MQNISSVLIAWIHTLDALRIHNGNSFLFAENFRIFYCLKSLKRLNIMSLILYRYHSRFTYIKILGGIQIMQKNIEIKNSFLLFFSRYFIYESVNMYKHMYFNKCNKYIIFYWILTTLKCYN